MAPHPWAVAISTAIAGRVRVTFGIAGLPDTTAV